MRQEDLSAIMKYPWESVKNNTPTEMKRCPKCAETYLGDGNAQCIECDTKEDAK